jgi:hypothetical protein
MLHEGVKAADGRIITFPAMPRRNETLEVWLKYLLALSELPSDVPHLHKAIEEAEQTIREKERIRLSVQSMR